LSLLAHVGKTVFHFTKAVLFLLLKTLLDVFLLLFLLLLKLLVKLGNIRLFLALDLSELVTDFLDTCVLLCSEVVNHTLEFLFLGSAASKSLLKGSILCVSLLVNHFIDHGHFSFHFSKNSCTFVGG
jgi:hypothetical protein